MRALALTIATALGLMVLSGCFGESSEQDAPTTVESSTTEDHGIPVPELGSCEAEAGTVEFNGEMSTIGETAAVSGQVSMMDGEPVYDIWVSVESQESLPVFVRMTITNDGTGILDVPYVHSSMDTPYTQTLAVPSHHLLLEADGTGGSMEAKLSSQDEELRDEVWVIEITSLVCEPEG